MKDLVKYSNLLTFYSPLFTKKQILFLDMYFNQDCSFAEIADKNNVSRAAAYDCINKAKRQLLKLENQLNLYQDYQLRISLYDQISDSKLKTELLKIEKR